MLAIGRSLAGMMMAVFLVLVSGCGGSSPPPPTLSNLPTNSTGAASAAGSPAATLIATPAYTLGSGDKLRVVVFRHEDLSGEFSLDGTGNFAMPLVGEIKALGLTSRELEERIVARLKDGFLVDPQVSVEVTNYRPFYILGEVTRPGQYEYVNGMTVLQAVTIAGGFTYRAKQDAVLLKRGGGNAQGVLVGGVQAILPGDVLEVQERFF